MTTVIDESADLKIPEERGTQDECVSSLPEDGTDTYEGAISDDGRDTDTAGEVNYEELMECDLAELKQEFAELGGIVSITELKNPLRYAALRDMGLTPVEAYLATAGRRRVADTRGHLTGSIPRAAGGPPSSMSKRELESARELFSGLTDSQIQKLYQRVTQ